MSRSMIKLAVMFGTFLVLLQNCAGVARAESLARLEAMARFVGFELPLVGEPIGTLYYSNGNTARSSGGTWYYSNGNTAISSGGTWYYTNGNTARSSGGTWYHANGNTAGRFNSVSAVGMVRFITMSDAEKELFRVAAAYIEDAPPREAVARSNFNQLHGI